VSSIVHVHQESQAFASKAVNVGLTLWNWLIGHRIVVFEQEGADRAAYGERLLPELAARLAAAGLRRVDARELRRFRLLYTAYPQIRETVSPEWLAGSGLPALLPATMASVSVKRETLSPESGIVETASPQWLTQLSFSHLTELSELPDATQRRFYEIECIRGSWSVGGNLLWDDLPDGGARVAFNTSGMEAVRHWLLQSGAEVVVESPSSLVTWFRTETERMAAVYRPSTQSTVLTKIP
jgi:hypothetical protein